MRECDREIRFQTANLEVTLHSPSIDPTCNSREVPTRTLNDQPLYDRNL
jgi:hypothetical protein